MGYNVVFEGTGEPNSNTKGVRTWSTYADADEFKKLKAELNYADTILAEGVEDDKALEMVKQTRLEDHVICAIEESITAEGRVNREVLAMKLQTLAFMLGNQGKER